MFDPPENLIKPDPEAGRKALKPGVGGSVVLLIIWGLAITGAERGGLMKPMGEMLFTIIVLLVSGIGCIGIAPGQFLEVKTRRKSFLSLFYGL